MSTQHPHWKTALVYKAHTPSEAHLLRVVLEEAGIPVIVEGEALQVIVGELPPWEAGLRILVPEAQLVHARDVIRRMQAGPPSRNDHQEASNSSSCLACGMAMGPTVVKCSSCGWSYHDNDGQ